MYYARFQISKRETEKLLYYIYYIGGLAFNAEEALHTLLNFNEGNVSESLTDVNFTNRIRNS